MGVEFILAVVGTGVSVVGVAIGYLQYRHAREESRHLQKLVTEREALARPVNMVAPQTPVTPNVAENAPVPQPALPPEPVSPTAGLEAALLVARSLSSPYDRDIKRVELFEEALKRRQFAFAANVVADIENAYDRERCKEQLSAGLMRVNNPALAVEVTQILTGRRG